MKRDPVIERAVQLLNTGQHRGGWGRALEDARDGIAAGMDVDDNLALALERSDARRANPSDGRTLAAMRAAWGTPPTDEEDEPDIYDLLRNDW